MTAVEIFAILLALTGFRLIRGWLAEAPLLPEAAYRERCLAAQVLRTPRLALPLLGLTAAPALFAPSVSWEAFAPVEGLRWVFAGIAGALAWSFSTYERNLFLGRSHGIDRILLVALAAGVALHPAFAPALLVLLTVVARQFELPRCLQYSHTHARLPMDLLTLLVAYAPVMALLGAGPVTLAVLSLSVAAGAYVVPALRKIQIGPHRFSWLTRNRLDFLVVNAHAIGWLGRAPTARVLRLARLLAPMGVGLAAATLGLELGAGLVLTGRWAAVAMLAGAIGLHLSILAVSGVNFWKWIVADTALLLMVAGMTPDAAAAVFTPEHLGASLAVLATHSLHLRPCALGWFDTRLCNFFRLEAVGVSGRVYQVPPAAMAPFDMVFAQSRHFHLYPGRVLTVSYGVTPASGASGVALLEALEASNGHAEDLAEIKADHGRCEHNEPLSREFDRFLRDVFGRRNTGRRVRGWWSRLAAPKHLYASRPGETYRGQEPVRLVRVRYIETWYDDRTLRTVTDEVVREVEIPSCGATRAADRIGPLPRAA